MFLITSSVFFLFMSQNTNDQGQFVRVKTKLTTKRKRECERKRDYIHVAKGWLP
jgi:hypothetical protein